METEQLEHGSDMAETESVEKPDVAAQQDHEQLDQPVELPQSETETKQQS